MPLAGPAPLWEAKFAVPPTTNEYGNEMRDMSHDVAPHPAHTSPRGPGCN